MWRLDCVSVKIVEHFTPRIVWSEQLDKKTSTVYWLLQAAVSRKFCHRKLYGREEEADAEAAGV